MNKLRKAVEDPSKIYPYLQNRIRRAEMSGRMWYYRLTSDSYPEAYRRLMRYRIAKQGPRDAVGSDELGIGKLQFEFLKERGLSPSDTLLDIGCGSLRGGQYFIEYLDKGQYTGMDISEEVIVEGKKLVGEKLIESQDPQFVVNEDLKFREISTNFDYLLGQSVFTHLPEEDIRQCFKHADSVLSSDGCFYATFFTDPEYDSAKNFIYNESKIEKMAHDEGWTVKFYSDSEFPHPRNQKIARFSRSNQTADKQE